MRLFRTGLAVAVAAGLVLAVLGAEAPKPNWIWYPGEENQANSTVYARWSFRLPAKPKSAVIRMTCDNKFLLYVNGAKIGEFQGEYDAWNYLFQYNVTTRLRVGLNVIAVQGRNVEGPAGLLVEGEIKLPNGQTIPIASSADWRVTNREQEGWQKPEYDDSSWVAPVLRGVPPVAPWGLPQVRPYQTLPLVSKPQHAVKVTKTSATGVTDVKLSILTDGRPAILKAGENQQPYIVLDFGRESVGILQMQFLAGSEGKCEVACGESLVEAMKGPFQTPFQVEVNGAMRWNAPDRRALRYLKLTALPGSHLLIDAAWLEAQGYPVKYRGYFECSDPLLNKIWQVSRHTLELCMQHFYEDGIKRDRMLWMGDTRVEALVNYYVFGDTKLIASSLEQLAAIQREDGAIPAVGPHTNTLLLPDYCAYWISGLRDYYEYSGDIKTVKKLWPNLLRQVEWFKKEQDEFGLLPNAERKDWWTFIDWADLDKRGEVTALNCVWYQALYDASRLAEASGDHPAGDSLLKAANKVQAAINERLWSEEKSAYVDCRVGDELSQKVSEQTNLLAVYTNVAHPSKWERIILYLFGSGRPVPHHSPNDAAAAIAVVPAPAEPAKPSVRTTTPYMNFYVMSALLSMGYREQAVKLIRDYWGEMVKRGATSFWETFDPKSPAGSTPSADMSYCHGWSSGPGRLLPEAILVGPLASIDTVRIWPQLGPLSWAKAVIPTRWGDMRVACWQRGGLCKIEVTIPRGRETIVSACGPGGASVYLDGKRRFQSEPEREAMKTAWCGVDIPVGPGKHVIEVRK